MHQTPTVSPEEDRRQLVQRIAASRYLSKSARLTELFLYLCRRSIDEGADAIHELEVGRNVFGRPPQYDTTSDNIVRVHASMLRKRIQEYFALEGADEPLLLEIPRGNYAPIFKPRSLALTEISTSGSEPDTPQTHSIPAAIPLPASPLASPGEAAGRPTGRSLALPLAITLALFFAALSLFLLWRLSSTPAAPHLEASAPGPAVRQFWSGIFPPEATAQIVLDDSAIELYQQITAHPLPLSDYFDRSYLSQVELGAKNAKLDPALIHSFILRRESSFSDAAILWNLAQISSELHSHAEIRFAREFSFRQARSGNVILLGNQASNPWIQSFINQLSLRWQIDPELHRFYPLDTRSSSSENEKILDPDGMGGLHDGYVTVSLLPNTGGKGNVLILTTTGGAALSAALGFLQTESSMKLLRSQLGLQNSTGAFPYFEILLRNHKGTGTPGSATLVIARPLRTTSSTKP